MDKEKKVTELVRFAVEILGENLTIKAMNEGEARRECCLEFGLNPDLLGHICKIEKIIEG